MPTTGKEITSSKYARPLLGVVVLIIILAQTIINIMA